MRFAGNFRYDVDRSHKELIKIIYKFGTKYHKIVYVRKDTVAYRSQGSYAEEREVRDYGTYDALYDDTLAAKVFKDRVIEDFLAWFDMEYYSPHIKEYGYGH
jgi:hypothetical protein